MTATARAELLDLYGFEKRWIRYERPVRIVDARVEKGRVPYLAWVHIDDDTFGGAVRWISEKNFTRFYREIEQEVTT